jgi:hypothetical protein
MNFRNIGFKDFTYIKPLLKTAGDITMSLVAAMVTMPVLKVLSTLVTRSRNCIVDTPTVKSVVTVKIITFTP